MTPQDEAFLRRLYASTRAEELAGWGLDAAQSEALAAMQFSAQRSGYRVMYPAGMDRVVLVDGEPAGRLLVDRSREEIRLVDVALLPEHRGRGVGRRLLEDILAEARVGGRTVRLSVLQENRAGRLYVSLGFRKVAEMPPYCEMEWCPDPAVAG